MLFLHCLRQLPPLSSCCEGTVLRRIINFICILHCFYCDRLNFIIIEQNIKIYLFYELLFRSVQNFLLAFNLLQLLSGSSQGLFQCRDLIYFFLQSQLKV